jgi:hypothetical protein
LLVGQSGSFFVPDRETDGEPIPGDSGFLSAGSFGLRVDTAGGGSGAMLPDQGYVVSVETIREWFRRTYGREATDQEVIDIEQRLAKREGEEAGRKRTPERD